MHVTAVLDMLGQPFTGTGPVGMSLRQDKAVTKKLLNFHKVSYPNYATFDKDNLEFAGKMRFPLFVKPLHGDTSLGIDDSSLVIEYSKLVERIGFIQTQLKVPALVEEYIEGREFYIGILGNDASEILPVMELDFTNFPVDIHGFMVTKQSRIRPVLNMVPLMLSLLRKFIQKFELA